MARYVTPEGIEASRKHFLTKRLAPIVVALACLRALVGCQHQDDKGNISRHGLSSVTVVEWPNQPRGMRVTEAEWNGGRRLVLQTITEQATGDDLVPMVCWGYVTSEYEPGGPRFVMPLLGGTYALGPLLDVGLEERRQGQEGLRRIYLCTALHLTDKSKAVVWEYVPVALDKAATRHEIDVGFPAALAGEHLKRIHADTVRPLFVTVIKDEISGELPLWVATPEWLGNTHLPPPQEGVFTLPPVKPR